MCVHSPFNIEPNWLTCNVFYVFDGLNIKHSLYCAVLL